MKTTKEFSKMPKRRRKRKEKGNKLVTRLPTSLVVNELL